MGIGILDIATVFSERERTLHVHRSTSNKGDSDSELTIAWEIGDSAVVTCDKLKKKLACSYDRDPNTYCLLEQVQTFILRNMKPKVGREQDESLPQNTALVVHNQATRRYVSEKGRESFSLIGSQRRGGDGSPRGLQYWLRFGVHAWTRS